MVEAPVLIEARQCVNCRAGKVTGCRMDGLSFGDGWWSRGPAGDMEHHQSPFVEFSFNAALRLGEKFRSCSDPYQPEQKNEDCTSHWSMNLQNLETGWWAELEHHLVHTCTLSCRLHCDHCCCAKSVSRLPLCSAAETLNAVTHTCTFKWIT